MKKVRNITILAVISLFMLASHTPARGGRASCGYDLAVDTVLGQSDLTTWLYWVEVLSGEQPIERDGFARTIRTRNTRYLFDGSPDARAYDYVLQQVSNWFPDTAIIEQTFNYAQLDAKNIILTIPGVTRPHEYVLLIAHLDDTSWNSARVAPGANDNAIGAATLLEAARLFRQLPFERSLRLIWFTGEEAGTLGSRAYVDEFEHLDYRGVINLDMFGWDGDGDRCFEIHVGTQAASDEIGRCLAENIAAYPHDLTYDYLINGATGRSDHVNFWLNDIGAIAIIENFSDSNSENGCVGADMNPHYHRREDTIARNLTPDYAYDIARAALETTASLAQPVAGHTSPLTPTLTIKDSPSHQVSLAWTAIPEAQTYRIFRASFGCQDWGLKIADTTALHWTDDTLRPNWPYQYRVEAVLPNGMHVSPPSNCIAVGPEPPPRYHYWYFPAILQ